MAYSRAEHLLAVYPDEKLKAAAVERGREVFGEGQGLI